MRVNEQVSDMINSAVKFGSEVNAAQEPNDTKILGAGYKRASVGKRICWDLLARSVFSWGRWNVF